MNYRSMTMTMVLATLMMRGTVLAAGGMMGGSMSGGSGKDSNNSGYFPANRGVNYETPSFEKSCVSISGCRTHLCAPAYAEKHGGPDAMGRARRVSLACSRCRCL